MAHSITSFISNFSGGSRANRFTVSGKVLNNATYHIRAATFPSSTLGVINVNYRGRTVPYPGERVYAPWVITILDDSDKANALFEAFHIWSNTINNHSSNLSTSWPFTDNSLTVSQLATNSETITRSCKLQNAWPQSIGEITYDMSSDNTLLTFAVTIGYSHYLPI